MGKGGFAMHNCNFLSSPGRILSIAWHEEENAIVTGGVDNIRVWGVTSGRAVQRMAVGKDGDKDTIVWAIAVTA